MTFYHVMKLSHVAAAIVFVGGLFARQVVRAQARQTDDVVWFAHLSKAASRIESCMVKPGSLVVLVLGVVQARIAGLPIFGVLTGGDQNWLLTSLLLYILAFAMVPLVFVRKGRAFRPILEEALAQGTITPALRVAMNDRTVAFAHHVEEAGTAAVLVLMVLKPF